MFPIAVVGEQKEVRLLRLCVLQKEGAAEEGAVNLRKYPN